MTYCVKMTTYSNLLKTFVFILALAFAWVPGAGADELGDAKAAGLVGETWRGYLAPVDAATPVITALVERINSARRVRYGEIAGSTGGTIEEVGLLTAQRVIERAAAGTYILDQSNTWRQK